MNRKKPFGWIYDDSPKELFLHPVKSFKFKLLKEKILLLSLIMDTFVSKRFKEFFFRPEVRRCYKL